MDKPIETDTGDRTEAIEVAGRWCRKEVWFDNEKEPARFVVCGGELRHARRLEGDLIRTYLQCLFCGQITLTMEYDLRTHVHRVVGELRWAK